MQIVPVVLSGGMGSRLWPLSRKNFPKQFINLGNDDKTMIQETFSRIDDKNIFLDPIVICNEEHRFIVAEQLIPNSEHTIDILLEPYGRNTAPALAAAAHHIKEKHGDESYMLVLPSDHIIADQDAFMQSVEKAYVLAQSNKLVTFGINPTRAETGFGYIKYGKNLSEDGYDVAEFVEKPSIELAQSYIHSGQYGWNSGIFLFPTDLYLQELNLYEPEIVRNTRMAVKKSTKDGDFVRLNKEAFFNLTSLSVDYALMEQTTKAAVIKADFGWDDAGSWESLWRIKPKDTNHNVTDGQNFLLETKDCYVSSKDGPPVAAIGVEDLIIISTKDCVLIADKNKPQDVKKLVDSIMDTCPELVTNYRQTYRPWGHYDCVDVGKNHKVKRISVNPHSKLSLQKHHHRAEHWVVVSGTAYVRYDTMDKIVYQNQSIYIPAGMVHRIENRYDHPLEIIEIQSGEYLEEDDIVRFEDHYGRAENKRIA